MEELQRTLLNNDKIRKLIVCNLQPPKTFQVGFKYKIPESDTIIEITQIVRDDNAFYLSGDVMYIVYAKIQGTGEEFIWQLVQGNPVVVEFFLPETKK